MILTSGGYSVGVDPLSGPGLEKSYCGSYGGQRLILATPKPTKAGF